MRLLTGFLLPAIEAGSGRVFTASSLETVRSLELTPATPPSVFHRN
ncbi:MAG: hypothetical protein ABSG26_07845 [Bryobacteraceae bacterium]|jgi:hypothetical protein